MNAPKNPKITVSFVAGLLVGVVAAVFVPRLVQSALSTTGLRDEGLLPGAVIGKRVEPERLLLTISTSEGSILATFTEDISAIDLLVHDGDSVTLETDGYRPFFDNPPIARVRSAKAPLLPPVDTAITADTSAIPDSSVTVTPPPDTSPPPADTAVADSGTILAVPDTAPADPDTASASG